jgi:class 3 adenylate cyclase
VTVIFCDLVDFTSRAEQLDPEEVRAIQAPYYRHVRAELERHGGTVEKFIGDARASHFDRGSPRAEPAARRWLLRYLSEGTPSLRDVAKVTASLAERERGAGWRG